MQLQTVLTKFCPPAAAMTAASYQYAQMTHWMAAANTESMMLSMLALFVCLLISVMLWPAVVIVNHADGKVTAHGAAAKDAENAGKTVIEKDKGLQKASKAAEDRLDELKRKRANAPKSGGEDEEA